MEGSYAFIFKSVHYPNEVIATRRGSPLLIGVKTAQKLKVDFVDVEFGNTTAETEPGKRKEKNKHDSFFLYYLITRNYVLLTVCLFF